MKFIEQIDQFNPVKNINVGPNVDPDAFISNGFETILEENLTTDVNEAPIAGDDQIATTKNKPVIIENVLANDAEPEGELLSISGFDKTSSQGGRVIQLIDHKFLYIPALDFSGNDSFTYTISDESGNTDTATVTVSVIKPFSFVQHDNQLNPFQGQWFEGPASPTLADVDGDGDLDAFVAVPGDYWSRFQGDVKYCKLFSKI